MLLLAEEIEHPTIDVAFDMGTWGGAETVAVVRARGCDTPCCIAGTTVILFGDENDYVCAHTAVRARRLLELTEDQAAQLFVNKDGYIKVIEAGTLRTITRAEAASAVRRMVAE
jgi:hypothetical protein